jgi:type II secretory pathway component PulK
MTIRINNDLSKSRSQTASSRLRDFVVNSSPGEDMSRPSHFRLRTSEGSVLVIVLWMALGLVSITLYFASSMTLELRAADNRVSSLSANQAIEAGARYVESVLTTFATNGAVPDVSGYLSEDVPVGDAHFWLIGRAGDNAAQMQPDQVFFGLIDEGSKLNLNYASTTLLGNLTNVTPELAANIYDWCHTNSTPSQNGDGPMVYAQFQPGYLCKQGPFETVDELRLVYPMDLETLIGEDANRNGALDPSETDTNRNGVVDPGLVEFVTVYSREPNTRPDGSQRINVSRVSTGNAQLTELLRTNLSSARFATVGLAIGLISPPSRNGPGQQQQRPTTPTPTTTRSFSSPLAFYLASGMTADEFAPIGNALTVASGSFIHGRINVNTASLAVLACLVQGDSAQVQQLVAYRQSYPDKLTSIAWVVDALGRNNATRLAQNDYLTTQSYQFTADIAAVGPYGRGYQRVRFVFDTTSGTPQIVYRQDLSGLGWALGRYVRRDILMASSQRN